MATTPQTGFERLGTPYPSGSGPHEGIHTPSGVPHYDHLIGEPHVQEAGEHLKKSRLVVNPQQGNGWHVSPSQCLDHYIGTVSLFGKDSAVWKPVHTMRYLVLAGRAWYFAENLGQNRAGRSAGGRNGKGLLNRKTRLSACGTHRHAKQRKEEPGRYQGRTDRIA